MYLKSGVDYYIVNLEGITIVCKSGLNIFSPKIKFKLLSYPDINKIHTMTSSGMSELDINEEIFNKCVLSIIGFEDEEIDMDESPAFVVDHIANKIRLNSLSILEDVEASFSAFLNTASLNERLALVVAHFTNQTYEYTQKLPVDELFKRYALCHIAFGVEPLILPKEEESKVGG